MKYSLPSTRELAEIVETPASTIAFLSEKRIIPLQPQCTKCHGPTALRIEKKIHRCTKFACRAQQSCMVGTFFSKHKTQPNRILEAAYYWLAKATNTQIETFTSLSDRTVTGIIGYFRQLVADSLDEIDLIIGGPGITVEIDETELGKRKYNRDHRIEGVWVLVGVERTAERKVLSLIHI